MTASQTLPVATAASVLNGKTPSKSEQRDSGHPVLKIKDVDALGSWRGTFSGHVDPDFAEKHTKKQLAGGETLILNAAHSATHVASKTFYANREVAGALATGEWLIVRWDMETTDPRFGNHWVNAPETRFRLRRLVKGIHLYPKDVGRLTIPLPPLAEQKRIAGILDAADALRAKRRESLAQLDDLLRSTFLEMFGDPVTNPMGWKVTRVEDLGSVQGGLQVNSKRRSLPLQQPYLRVANVHRGYLDLAEIKTIRLTEAEKARTTLQKEDILIVEGHGNKDEIGRCSRWDGSIKNCVHQNHLIRLRCAQSDSVAVYVETYLNSRGGRRGLLASSRTTSGLNTISVSKVKATRVLLPPLDLQHRFAAIVETAERQKERQRAHLTELDTLFASLQSRAFRGDL